MQHLRMDDPVVPPDLGKIELSESEKDLLAKPGIHRPGHSSPRTPSTLIRSVLI